MTPQEFLAVVLPSPDHGLYCTTELSTVKKEHTFAETINDALAPVDGWVERQLNTYFALATFDPAVKELKRGRRTAANARYVRSLFIDMDGYASKKQAAHALSAFLEATSLDNLGLPWVVASGGGLHCYWPLRTAVKVEDWKPVAESFKRLCKQHRLSIDMTVTADAARVLRVPGTLNFKDKYPAPRPVQFLTAGDVFDFDALAAAIDGQLQDKPQPTVTTTALALPGNKPKAPPTATAIKLFENTETRFKQILLRTKQGTGCEQLKFYVENATDEGMEPMWRGWLSLAKVCVDGEKAAVWLSQLHPYDEDRMHQKLREIRGPYPCIKFDSENPGICGNCPHYGKITNPLALGRVAHVESTAKEVEVQVEDEAPQVIKRPVPPRGYSYGVKGGVFMHKTEIDKTGNESRHDIMLLPYDLFVVDILKQQGAHIVHMLALKPNEGAVSITVPQKAMVSKDECSKALAEQNVLAAWGAGNDKNLFEYVRACVEQASTGKVAVKIPSAYGWQEDDTFVYASRVYTANQKPLTLPMAGLENLVHNTKPTGSIEAWRAFIELLVAKKLYKHLAVMLAGAGAPLMRFTGIYGMTFHCGSTESGTGKTLALEAAASVWGHPTHYRTGKGTSPVAMQQRLGMLNSLPLITDEITSKNRKDFEWFPEFLLDMTEGRGKERMEAGSNKERLNLSTWMSNAIMSSNTHVVDNLTAARTHASEGELRRVLEFIMDQDLVWEAHEIEVIKSLQHNFGVAGDVLAQYLADHVPQLKTLVPEVVRQMYTTYKATNDERFWMAGAATIVGAAILFSDAHTGIANIPIQGVIEVVGDSINSLRTSIKGNTRTAEDVLNSYTRDNFGSLIIVTRNKNRQFVSLLGDGKEIDAMTPRNSIMGRVEHGIEEGFVDYFIEERLLKAYCASMSFGYADFKKKIGEFALVMRQPRKDMTSRTNGPPMRASVLQIRRKIADVEDAVTLPVPLETAKQG